jgi:hypothetical protein
METDVEVYHAMERFILTPPFDYRFSKLVLVPLSERMGRSEREAEAKTAVMQLLDNFVKAMPKVAQARFQWTGVEPKPIQPMEQQTRPTEVSPGRWRELTETDFGPNRRVYFNLIGGRCGPRIVTVDDLLKQTVKDLIDRRNFDFGSLQVVYERFLKPNFPNEKLTLEAEAVLRARGRISS